MKRLPPDIKRRILSNLVDIVLGDEPDELEICEQVILELIVEQVERAATLSEKNAKNGRKRTNDEPNTNTITNTNTKESESAYAPTPATSQSADEIGHCKSEWAQPITDTANTTPNLVKTCKSKGAKPTVDEIRAYCVERKNDISPQRFFDYYESKGWIVGKSPMRDWKAAVRTWEQNGSDNHAQKQEAGGKQNDKYAGMCGDTVYL